MNKPVFNNIVEHYEACMTRHGGGARAVDWKSEADASIRYDIMLDLVRPSGHPITLLDFGCGLGHFKDHLIKRDANQIAYVGLDVSPQFAAAARLRHPEATIHCCDILTDRSSLPQFDYVVMNGIFTRRHDLSQEAMTSYMHDLVWCAFDLARIGLAFNVMSEVVDWEVELLFHAKMSDVAQFVGNRLSKHFILRNDYNLHETTCYVYREPTVGQFRSRQQA